MITEAGITGGEVAAEVMIDMSVTGTVGETGTIVAEAGAAVPVLITRVVDGDAMMMSVIVEAGADLWIGLHSLILGSFSFDFSLSLLLFNFFFLVIPYSRSPVRHSPSPRRSPSPQRSISPQRSTSPRKSPRGESPDNRSRDGKSPTPRSVSPRGRPDASRSPSPRNSNGDVSIVCLEF